MAVPTIVSASIAGYQLVVVFSEPVANQSSIGPGYGLAIKYNGGVDIDVTYVDGEGTDTGIYSVTPEPVGSEVVTLSYDDIAGLYSVSTSEYLAAITGVAVTNISPQRVTAGVLVTATATRQTRRHDRYASALVTATATHQTRRYDRYASALVTATATHRTNTRHDITAAVNVSAYALHIVLRTVNAATLVTASVTRSTVVITRRDVVVSAVVDSRPSKVLQQFRLRWNTAAADLPVLYRSLIVVQLKMANRVQSPEVTVTLASTGERIPAMVRHEYSSSGKTLKLVIQPYRAIPPSDMLVDYLDYP